MKHESSQTGRYRQRIYQYYNTARQHALAPENLDGFKPRAPYLRKLIREHFPSARTASILDLGCGHGTLMYFAAEAGYKNIRGVDTSPEQVNAALRLGISGIQQGDLLDTLNSYSAQSLDAIIAFDVIEHFLKDELIDFADAVYRVLCKDGCLIIHTVNGESPFGDKIRYGDFTHELAFTRTSISQLFLSSGFAEVSCFEEAPIPHSVQSSLRWILWQIIRGISLFYIAVETGDGSSEHIFSQNFLAVVKK